MADEEVDFEEAVELGDAPMEETAGAASGGGKKGRDATGRRLKGRGTQGSATTMEEGGKFESIEKGGSVKGPQKSVEGWLIILTGLHEETQEDDIHDKFCDFGDIKNLHLNLDRRTGFVKGYGLVEYEELKQAQDAISTMNGAALMGANINVDWAFSKGPSRRLKGRGTQGSATTMEEGGKFESIEKGGSVKGPQKSVEGWLIILTGLHEETQEDDIHDKFCDFGDIKNLHLNLDRRTGFVKGYGLVEYEELKQAQDAISTMNGAALMGANINVDWAFSKGPSRRR